MNVNFFEISRQFPGVGYAGSLGHDALLVVGVFLFLWGTKCHYFSIGHSGICSKS